MKSELFRMSPTCCNNTLFMLWIQSFPRCYTCWLITIIGFFSFSQIHLLFGCVNRAMAGPELLLDSSIRMWVVLPIVFITFFVGIIRHYVTQLLHSDKKVDLEQVSDRWDTPGCVFVWVGGCACASFFVSDWLSLGCQSSDVGVRLQSGAPAQPHPPGEREVHPSTGEPTQCTLGMSLLKITLLSPCCGET